MAAKDGEILSEGESELEVLDRFAQGGGGPRMSTSDGVDHERRLNDGKEKLYGVQIF